MREILSKNDEVTDLSREMKQEFNLSESSSLFGTCVDGLITWMHQREDDLPQEVQMAKFNNSRDVTFVRNTAI